MLAVILVVLIVRRGEAESRPGSSSVDHGPRKSERSGGKASKAELRRINAWRRSHPLHPDNVDLVEAGLLASPYPGHRDWRLLEDDHSLTAEAAEVLGLDANERAAVQKRFDQLFAEEARDFAQRGVLRTELSDVENGISIYDYPASEDRGAAVRAKLRADLERLAGTEEAELMMASLTPPHCGFYGRLDVRIMFFRVPAAGDAGDFDLNISWECVDPRTGRPVLSHSRISADRLRMCFGQDVIIPSVN